MRETRRSDILLAFAIAVGLFLFYLLRGPLLLIYVSIIFAVIFLPIVERISRLRIGRWSPSLGASVLIFIGGVILAIGLFFALALPPIVNDAQGLSKDLPGRLQHLQAKLNELPLGSKIAERLNASSMEQYLGTLAANALKFFQGVAGGVTAFFTLIILTAYFMLDGRRAFQWGLSLMPLGQRDRLRDTLNRGKRRMQRWLGGQLALMVILASSTAIVLGLLGVRYFYAIAVFAGVANFIPILGPIATVILAVIVAALDSWTKVVGVLIFYAAYQQVENSYLTPRIMTSTVNLPAVAVIIALLLGSTLAGLWGAIVAVPTAALLATFINEYAIKHLSSSAEKKKLTPIERAS